MIPQDVTDLLAAYPPEVRDIALRLRDVVVTRAPQAIEQVDRPARLLGYGLAPTYAATICVIMPLKAGVNLGFPRGVELPDPTGLLAGTGKRARHVRLSAAEQVDAPALHALIDAAIAATPPPPSVPTSTT